MISLPDFKEKQILFIITEDVDINKIKFFNDNICFVKNNKIENQISFYKIFAIFIVGDCSLTTVFIKNCKKYGISIFLMNKNFLTYCGLSAVAEGNYLVRSKQYMFDNQRKLIYSKKLIHNKIENQIFLLENINSAKINILKQLQFKIEDVNNFKELLGIEGVASKNFFKEYFYELDWYRRLPRAKIDPINLLMDIGYTFLFNFVDGIICLYGLDTYIGFYHKLFFQRKSLTCDLIEPFRCIIDKQILKSYHLHQIDYKDFKKEKGSYFLYNKERDKYLEIFSEAIMDKKEEIFCYVRDYYYSLMNDSEFPIFKIN